MKDIVERIYQAAPLNWDGEFMALDDAVKDAAVKAYIIQQGLGREVFPECCSGAETILTESLYSDPLKFYAIYKVLVDQAGDEDRFFSEAIDLDSALKLRTALDAEDALQVAMLFGEAFYGYCEDALRDACYDHWQEIHHDILEGAFTNELTDIARENAA